MSSRQKIYAWITQIPNSNSVYPDKTVRKALKGRSLVVIAADVM